MAPVERFLQRLGLGDLQGLTVAGSKEIPAQEARYACISGLPEPLPSVLGKMGLNRLYTHQARAIDLIRSGRSVVTATPTASGKSLIYNLPVLESILLDHSSRALYLFPLKALTRDQLSGLQEIGCNLKSTITLQCQVYDGDTEPQTRARIRGSPPHIILTNPDMLHRSFLPYHRSWKKFFSRLKYIIVDEVHTYRGVMGSNMAWVFRRLKRVCNYYGQEPVFIFSSATIGNPGDLCNSLTGTEPEAVLEGGAPGGIKHFLLLDPELNGAARAAIMLLKNALELGLRTIVYTQSRKMTELIAIWAAQSSGEFREYISAYRAGFLPEQRREIEQKLASGELLAVVSTSALELGIDIGHLDLCLLVGYPGSIMSTMQRGGRVGRSKRESAIILIAHEDALDQYFIRNPEEFFRLKPENAVINPDNPIIMRRHILCAASELPLKSNEKMLDMEVKKCIQLLEKEGEILSRADLEYFYARTKYPHKDVDLRGAGQNYNIFDHGTGEYLGEVDGIRVFKEAHPGAVYLHLGQTYVVENLDTAGLAVYVRKVRVDYYTRPISEKQTRIVETWRCKSTPAGDLYLGRLKVTEQISAYEKRLVRGQSRMGVVPLDLPAVVFETQGIWFTVDDSIRLGVEEKKLHFMGGLHALEHGIIGCMPMIVLTDRNDLGGIATPCHDQLQKGAVFIYDGTPGGVGLCRQAFELAEELLSRAAKVILSCSCENGCPACIHSPKCGSGNRPLDKDAAGHLLKVLVSGNFGPAKDHGAKDLMESKKKNADLEMEIIRPRENSGHFAVMDIETRYSAQEVGGWHNCHQMGVSCAVVYNSEKDDFLAFTQEQIQELAHFLKSFRLIVGFNIIRFDYRVLQGQADFDFQSLPTVDILHRVESRLGHRLSLDHLARHTLGVNKTANGLLALKWWKEGKMDKIINYCRQDVAITRDLYLFGRDRGYLIYQNKARHKVRLPVKW